MNADEDLCSSVLVIRKSFAGRKGFFFAKSSRSWRSSRLRGESRAGLSPRRREAREENAKDFSLVAAMPLCVHLVVSFILLVAAMPRRDLRSEAMSLNFHNDTPITKIC